VKRHAHPPEVVFSKMIKKWTPLYGGWGGGHSSPFKHL
jgi:hypothetical protein